MIVLRTVSVKDDYVSMADRECYLYKLASKPPGVFPRVVSILSWKEVDDSGFFILASNLRFFIKQLVDQSSDLCYGAVIYYG